MLFCLYIASITGVNGVITIDSPENKTYDINVIELNVSSDVEGVVWHYTLDNGVVVEFTPNITLTNISDGHHVIVVTVKELLNSTKAYGDGQYGDGLYGYGLLNFSLYGIGEYGAGFYGFGTINGSTYGANLYGSGLYGFGNISFFLTSATVEFDVFLRVMLLEIYLMFELFAFLLFYRGAMKNRSIMECLLAMGIFFALSIQGFVIQPIIGGPAITSALAVWINFGMAMLSLVCVILRYMNEMKENLEEGDS